jgi:hypothetical protein
MKKMIMLSILVFSLIGCTDADYSKFKALGDSANIKCYSGELLIYEGTSTGAIENETQSDGYYFRDKTDNVLKMVSGNCIISYDVKD